MTQQGFEIKVNSDYERLLPKLSNEEYEELKQSIKNDGLHYSIVVNKEGVVLDGHHRFHICQELGIEPKIEIKEFPNGLLEKKFVIESNLKRRHLNKFQRAKLILPLLEIEKQLAKERQLSGFDNVETPSSAKYFADDGKPKKKPLTEEQKEARRVKAKLRREAKKKTGIIQKEPARATAIVAKKVSLSDRTLEKAKDILEKGSEELKQKLENDEMSISYAYKIVKRNERIINQPPLPEGQFEVIYADPPWAYDLDLRGDPSEHYAVMADEQICNLKPPIADNAILFLWATNPKLREALNVLKAWGFEYKTNLVWVKDKIGTGYYVRGQHELLLIGIKGNFVVPKEEARPSSVLMAPRTEHSKKPVEVYDLIERMYPQGHYLELFATQKREKWTSWGSEVEA